MLNHFMMCLKAQRGGRRYISEWLGCQKRRQERKRWGGDVHVVVFSSEGAPKIGR